MTLHYTAHEGDADRAGDITLVVEDRPGWLGALLGQRPRVRRFYGSCTVWHEMPTFRRCSTWTEAALADIWTRLRYEERRKVQRLQDRIEESHNG